MIIFYLVMAALTLVGCGVYGIFFAEEPDGFEVILGGMLAVVVAIIWPLFLPGVFVISARHLVQVCRERIDKKAELWLERERLEEERRRLAVESSSLRRANSSGYRGEEM